MKKEKSNKDCVKCKDCNVFPYTTFWREGLVFKYKVKCTKCSKNTMLGMEEKEAVAQWNKMN